MIHIIGNKNKFAIQYQITKVYRQFFYGNICYWINNTMLGKYDMSTTLSDLLLFLPVFVRDCGNRMHDSFYSMQLKDVFYCLSGEIFLKEDVEIEEKACLEQWARFDISMPIDVFRETMVFLIDDINMSRIIYSNHKDINEYFLEKGYVDLILKQLYAEFNIFFDHNCTIPIDT